MANPVYLTWDRDAWSSCQSVFGASTKICSPSSKFQLGGEGVALKQGSYFCLRLFRGCCSVGRNLGYVNFWRISFGGVWRLWYGETLGIACRWWWLSFWRSCHRRTFNGWIVFGAYWFLMFGDDGEVTVW